MQIRYPWRELPKGAGLITKLIWLVSISVQIFLLLLKRRPRAVHCFLPTGTIIVGSLAWMLGIKSRIMSRRSLNNYAKNLPKFIRNYEVFIQKKFHLVVGNSQAVCDQLIEEELRRKRLCSYTTDSSQRKKFRRIKREGQQPEKAHMLL